MHRSLLVGRDAAGLSVDRFLADRLTGWNLARARWAIRNERVISDRRKLQPHSLLVAGEELTVLPPPEARARPPMPALPAVLHEDEDCLAVDKPPGLLMHPTGRTFSWGLINVLRHHYPQDEIHLAHRLDQYTSGVCLLARNAVANQRLKADFKERRVRKTYWAIVRGRPDWELQCIEAPIGEDENSPIRIKMGVVPGGQAALTRVRVLQRFRELSLVSCRPETGRTHQLRVHLEHVGHPILGDRIYGQDPDLFLGLWEGRFVPQLRERLGHPRHCLHARALHVGELSVRAPMPSDMARVLQRA